MCNKYQGVDESTLSPTDRLGLAWCRLNSSIWDDFIGEKPPGFDELPDFDGRHFRFFRRKIRTKADYVLPAMHAIEQAIGRANVSRCWWQFNLHRSEAEWHEWYFSGKGL